MSLATVTISSQITNHDLRKLIDKTTDLLKLAAVQAINSRGNSEVYKFVPTPLKVGGKKQISYPSASSVVGDRFDRLDESGKKAAKLALGRDATITSLIRRYAVDMRSSKSVIAQIDIKSHYSFVNGESFGEAGVTRMLKELSSVSMADTTYGVSDALSADLAALATRYGSSIAANASVRFRKAIEDAASKAAAGLNTGVNFRVHEVKCVDETSPEWPGSDEISWGGAAVDDKGNSLKISEYFVGGGFDDGDKKGLLATQNCPILQSRWKELP